MHRPSLFVLGAQKCGTTTVADILSAQPEIFIPSIKETYFFCDNKMYDMGVDKWMSEFYPIRVQNDEKILGDATPFCLASLQAQIRIKDFIGDDGRYIVVLRDPVARAYSAYWHQCRLGYETLSFEDALDAERERVSAAKHSGERWWRHAYVTVGEYAAQLTHVFDLFGRTNVLVLTEQDLLDVSSLQASLRVHLRLPARNDTPKISRSNQAGMPRSKMLQQLVIGRSGVKQLAQTILPREVRTRLGRALLQVNIRERTNPPMAALTRARLNAHFS